MVWSVLKPLPVISLVGKLVWANVPQTNSLRSYINQVVKVLAVNYDDHGYEESFKVMSQFGQVALIHSNNLGDEMTLVNRPVLFYRLAQLETGYKPWKLWIGPNWGNSAGHIMAGRPASGKVREARQFMEEAWCLARPLARVIDLDPSS